MAYDEPSIRPDDSRYGDNPNRLQRHTQFQVIVKPAPKCAQELVVASYRALGIDTCKHDIRFVEDNWESPALGAWGLGWEVWLDGMEITQFTYFQQAGGMPLESVAVEITYGLERIIMSLQGKSHFKDIVFANGVTYGDIFMQNEVEMSRYNLDDADIGRNNQMFELYEAEALALLERRLPVPAYNYLLKASHTFNVLDARGAIGVTERARYFKRMRTLARDVAKSWVDRRQEEGFPLLEKEAPKREDKIVSQGDAAAIVSMPRADLVFEIGLEELPAGDVSEAMGQVGKLLSGILSNARLEHSSIEVNGTPRRISALVRGLKTKQDDQVKRVRGPPLNIALKDGELTKAGTGFLRSQGMTNESAIEFNEKEGYMYAAIEVLGRSTVDVLAEALPVSLLAKMSFKKSMRWNDSDVSFSRPVRWLLCLLGDQCVPFEFANVKTTKTTRSLRQVNGFAADISVDSADDYPQVLADLQITASREERSKYIRTESVQLAKEIGGLIPSESLEGALLDEVTDLVESPLPLLGRFDEDFLQLPEEVLVTVMKKHQRYLPIVDEATGNLRNGFIAVANGDSNLLDVDAVRRGNEAVLHARYSDAAFFYSKDTVGRKLVDFVPKLTELTFQEKLGSMLDKVNRIKEFLPIVANRLGLHVDPEEIEATEETAGLFKADLATSMVIEMTSLAGTMGRHYALKSREVSETVADAIFEANLPRFSGDKLPKLGPAIACSVADRLDSLVALFHVGLIPKATADPFALRRAALGIVQTLIDCRKKVHLPDLLPYVGYALSVQINEEVTSKTKDSVLEFISRRLEGHLLDNCGFRDDVVKAVMNTEHSAVDPQLAHLTCETITYMLGKEKTRQTLIDAQATYDRVARLLKGVTDYTIEELQTCAIDTKLFESDIERRLWSLILRERDGGDLILRMNRLQKMKKTVDDFFDNVYVNAEDKRVRTNRLCLCAKLVDLTDKILDLSLLQL